MKARPDVSRRRFVRGAAALGLVVAAPFARAQSRVASTHDLVVGETPFGKGRFATTVNGSLPAPTLYWCEGDTVTIRVTNRLAVPTSIHWHGLLVPAAMDGVPGISFDGIAPGSTFTYRFPLVQSGTYWYHAHSRFQEQTGLYGAIVVAPQDGERVRAERDHVVLLSDWTDEDPEAIYATLKTQSDAFAQNRPTVVQLVRDIRALGYDAAIAKRAMWNRMRMLPTDLADVTAATYTYLVNGASPDANAMLPFVPGERVRLRLVNGSSMTIFDVRVPGVALTVVAADGQDVEPVTVDELRIAPAETYDVVVRPRDDRAYTVFAQAIDRGGYARATLAPPGDPRGTTAAVPAVDRPQWLSMADMMGSLTMVGMAHGHHAGSPAPPPAAGMDHAAMGHGAMDRDPMDHAAMDHGPMDHAGMGHGSTAHGTEPAAPTLSPTARHARTEYSPSVDMRVDTPRTNLDDPGVGLRDNGRRVLTYADLHTIGGPRDPRGPSRNIELHLTGHMERYAWSFDGQKFSDARPLRFRRGERLRLVVVNDTMMPHPIHLHGMWSEVEDADQRFALRKHTVLVQPAQRVTWLVTADAPGRWAFHCHLLYHMEAGMFREVVVA